MGMVTKREKERKEREKKHLTGLAGKSLFLEALQLILRYQLAWMIREKGFRAELETVVRDLWDLRIRAFSALLVEESDAPDTLEMFSSQPLPDDGEAAGKTASSTDRSWSPDKGSNWPMPRMIDTLGLCYLGCLLLRMPVRLGEMFQWVTTNNMPYHRAYLELPQEMRDRMPSAYTYALKFPMQTPLASGALHQAVLHLAICYRHNYELVFPAISYTPVLIQLTRDLALPVEVVHGARELTSELGCTFEFPVRKNRVYPVDHPEILLLSLLVISAKLCLPLNGSRSLTDAYAFDWKQWSQTRARQQRPTQGARSMTDLSSQEIVSLNEEDLDQYFSQIASLNDSEVKNPVTRFFPVDTAPALEPPIPELGSEDWDASVQRVLTEAVLPQPTVDEQTTEHNLSVWSDYPAYRHTEDLDEAGALLYEAAAELGGLETKTLVRAVYMLEQRVLRWQRQQPGPGL